MSLSRLTCYTFGPHQKHWPEVTASNWHVHPTSLPVARITPGGGFLVVENRIVPSLEPWAGCIAALKTGAHVLVGETFLQPEESEGKLCHGMSYHEYMIYVWIMYWIMDVLVIVVQTSNLYFDHFGPGFRSSGSSSLPVSSTLIPSRRPWKLWDTARMEFGLTQAPHPWWKVVFGKMVQMWVTSPIASQVMQWTDQLASCCIMLLHMSQTTGARHELIASTKATKSRNMTVWFADTHNPVFPNCVLCKINEFGKNSSWPLHATSKKYPRWFQVNRLFCCTQGLHFQLLEISEFVSPQAWLRLIPGIQREFGVGSSIRKIMKNHKENPFQVFQRVLLDTVSTSWLTVWSLQWTSHYSGALPVGLLHLQPDDLV